MIDPTYRDDDHDVPRSFSGFLIIMMIFRSRSESLGHRDGATGTASGAAPECTQAASHGGAALAYPYVLFLYTAPNPAEKRMVLRYRVLRACSLYRVVPYHGRYLLYGTVLVGTMVPVPRGTTGKKYRGTVVPVPRYRTYGTVVVKVTTYRSRYCGKWRW